MTDEAANEDYDLLHRCHGVSVTFSSRPDGNGGYTGPGHLSVQTSGYAEIDLDHFLPVLHQIRSTFDLEFLGPVTDDQLRNLSGLTKILRLKICCGAVTDAGLRHLDGLTSLTALDLSGQVVTDAGMVHLGGLSGLWEIILRWTKVGNGGLAMLGSLTSLRKLDLGGCPVTDGGIAAIGGLTGLTSVDLSGTQVGDEGLAVIGRLALLKNLSLDGLPVTDRGGRFLGGLSDLQSLSLHQTRVGAENAAWLAGLNRLGWLTLSETAVSDEVLRHLAKLDRLISLRLDKTAVTGAGLARLPEALSHLSLTGVRLREDDWAALGRLRSLHSIVVDADVVSEAAENVLERMSFGRRPAWSEDVVAFERLKTCPLCRRPIRNGEPVFCTRPYTPPDPELFSFARVPIHWSCYATWDHRPRFARQYFDEQVRWAEGNEFWSVARKDEAVLVSVNPAQYVEEVDVILAATGSSLRVPLGAWEEWVAVGWLDSCAHESERDALGEVLPALRADLPSAEALLAAAGIPAEDAGGPSPHIEPGGMVDRITYEFACEKLATRAGEKGMACPHCDYFGMDFQYERVESVSTDGPRSSLVCPACEARFGPDEV